MPDNNSTAAAQSERTREVLRELPEIILLTTLVILSWIVPSVGWISWVGIFAVSLLTGGVTKYVIWKFDLIKPRFYRVWKCAVCEESLKFDDDLQTDCVLCGVDRHRFFEADRIGKERFENKHKAVHLLVCPSGHYLCPNCWKEERVKRKATELLEVDS